MSDTVVRVGVRHRNGSINLVDVKNVPGWDGARNFVLEQVPTARTVLALIERKQPAPVVRPAA